MRVTTKDLVIGNKKFQLRKFTPLVGVWIGNVLMASTLTQQQTAAQSSGPTSEEFNKLTEEEKAQAAISAMWLLAADSLSREKYSQIQMECLQACSLYVRDDVPPVPMNVNEIGEDVSLLNQLVTESLQFNLTPFFSAGGLSQENPPKGESIFSSGARSYAEAGISANSGTVPTR